MSLSVTEWIAPCGCVVRHAFDAREPEGARKHTSVPFDGRRGCDAHGHTDHHQHYRNLREHHMMLATLHDPTHPWSLLIEDDGGIRDVKG